MTKRIPPSIAVIILIATIVAIAGTILMFIEETQPQKSEEKQVQGWIVGAYSTTEKVNTTYGTKNIWNLSISQSYQDIDNSTSYSMVFVNCSPPPEDVHLKMFYTNENSYLKVYRVKSL